jgi:AAA15 family ATPase/GTPase
VTEIYGDQPLLYGALEGMERLFPLQLMGEGMVRLTDLILNIAGAPNGVVLVDEIETGFHYSVLPKVWQAIARVAREMNTQVFATTHSRECLIAAHQAFSKSEIYDFRLFRLEFGAEGKNRVVAYDRELLEFVLERDWEVR